MSILTKEGLIEAANDPVVAIVSALLVVGAYAFFTGMHKQLRPQGEIA